MPENSGEQLAERFLVSDPFEREDGNVVRSFYHSAVGYGQVEASADNPANVASVTFYDLPGGVYAAVQPNSEEVASSISYGSKDLELGAESPAHQAVLRLAEKALGLQIVPPAVTFTGKSRLHTLQEHVREQFRIGEYGTEDPERLASLEAIVGRIINAQEEELEVDDWEGQEESELNRRIEESAGWQTIEDPLEEGRELEAAAIISEDPDYGRRSFTIVAKREDGSLRHVAHLSHMTETLAKQLLMMPMNPKDNIGAILISWNSREAKAFLTAAGKLLGVEKQ